MTSRAAPERVAPPPAAGRVAERNRRREGLARLAYTPPREPLEADPRRPRGRGRGRPVLRREGRLPGDRRPRLRPGPPGHGPALRGRLADRRLRQHAARGRPAPGQPRRPPARRAAGPLAGPRVPAAPRAPRREGRCLLLLRRARARARHRLARPLHPGQPLPLPRQQRGPGGGRLRRARRRGPDGAAPQADAPRAPARVQRGHGTRGEPARPAHPARHLRDRRPHRRHHAARGVRAAAGVRADLRRLRLPADVLAAARARGRADAGRPPADDHARPGRARHRVRHVQPLHRAPHPRGALAHAPRRAAGEGRRDGRRARERARGRARPDCPSTSRTARRCSPSASCCSPAGTPGVEIPAARYPALGGRRAPRGLREHQHGDPVPARPRARAGRPLPALRGLGRPQQPLRGDDLGHAHAGGGRPRHLPHHGPDRAAAGRASCATSR